MILGPLGQGVYFIIVLWADYLESAQVNRFQWTPWSWGTVIWSVFMRISWKLKIRSENSPYLTDYKSIKTEFKEVTETNFFRFTKLLSSSLLLIIRDSGNENNNCFGLKVKTLWEGHKIWKKFPTNFDKTAGFTQ